MQRVKNTCSFINIFPGDASSRESWRCLVFSHYGVLTVGFGFTAAANSITIKSARERALAAYLRHLARQHRTDMPLEALPAQICEATLEARAYVLVRQGARMLAVYQVKPGGYVARLKRWPQALERPLA